MGCCVALCCEGLTRSVSTCVCVCVQHQRCVSRVTNRAWSRASCLQRTWAYVSWGNVLNDTSPMEDANGRMYVDAAWWDDVHDNDTTMLGSTYHMRRVPRKGGVRRAVAPARALPDAEAEDEESHADQSTAAHSDDEHEVAVKQEADTQQEEFTRDRGSWRLAGIEDVVRGVTRGWGVRSKPEAETVSVALTPAQAGRGAVGSGTGSVADPVCLDADTAHVEPVIVSPASR